MERTRDPLSALQYPRNRRNGGLVVWESIALDGRTHLHVFERGTVRNKKEPYVCLFKGAVDPDFILKMTTGG
ncbi:hypothetical protein TNCV_1072501 [Trichonephila clavipes]|nr:hypothetical protein TNCV_1072501 [Trichonephila clavipes]